MPPLDMRRAWNQVAAQYQSHHAIGDEVAHYGPWAPPESELQLLGDVRGRRVLEVGCGGGQCSVALARQGAIVAGVDISEAQLEYASRLAAQAGVTVKFVHGAAEDLRAFADGAWDLVFSVYTLQYIADVPACLAACARVLHPQGRLIFSLDHPFRDCFFDDAEQELTPYPARDYFAARPLMWTFTGTGVQMRSYHHPLATWIDMLHAAGFRLLRLLEPLPPVELLDELWPEDGPLAVLRHLPQTVIFVAERTG